MYVKLLTVHLNEQKQLASKQVSHNIIYSSKLTQLVDNLHQSYTLLNCLMHRSLLVLSEVGPSKMSLFYYLLPWKR